LSPANLIQEKRDNRSTGGQDIPITNTNEPCVGTGDIRTDKDPFLQCLRHAHDIHRFTGFIGGNADDCVHREPLLPDSAHDILGALDIGADSLKGEIFAGRNLLEGRSVEDNISVPEDGADTVVIANVPNLKLQEPLEIMINDFIGSCLKLPLELEPYRVLFR